MALVSRHADWELLGRQLWWVRLVVAGSYILLSAPLLFGLGRLVRHDRRREIVIALLALVWVFNVLGVLVLVVSLVSPSGVHVTGRQLLFGGGAMWLTVTIAFGQRWRPRPVNLLRLEGSGRPAGPGGACARGNDGA